MGQLTPADIAPGSLCLIDTNILLYAEQGKSLQAQGMLRNCAAGQIVLVAPGTVWHETAHKLMLAEAFSRGMIPGNNPAKWVAGKPEAIRALTAYRAKIQALADLGVRFEPSSFSDLLPTGLDLQRKYGLLTNDSLILAAALRLKADVLISCDKAFSNQNEIPVCALSDIA